MAEHDTQDHSLVRVGGRLHKLTPIVDQAGRIVHHAVTPLTVRSGHPNLHVGEAIHQQASEFVRQ